MAKEIIQKVWKNKGNNQKLVTIPSKSEIESGDYVKIKKVTGSDNKTNKVNEMKAILEIECENESELNVTCDRIDEAIEARGDLEKFEAKETQWFRESYD